MASNLGRLWAPAVVGVIAFVYFHLARGYPLSLALIMGAAIMFLGWAIVRTWEQLRGTRRR